MGSSGRVRLSREKRIADTLIAARAVFEKHGYADAAMSEIASKVGVVEGALYRFFASKADLLMAVTSQWHEEIIVPLYEGLPKRKTLRDRLHFVVWHHLMCIQTSPELVNLFFNVVRMDKRYLGSELFNHNRRYVNLVADILREGVETGELRADLPIELTRNMTFGLVEQQSWAYRCGLGGLDVERVANDVTNLVLAAARPPAPPSAIDADAASRIGKLALQIHSLAQGGREART